MPHSGKSKPPARAGRQSRAAPARQVRIIGGQWKRTPLPVLDAEGLRPTPDRVRETLFNWLNFLLDGDWARLRCVDLFAGSGALGFEAASRGAAQVTLVESGAAAVRQLEAVRHKLNAGQLTIVRADAFAFAQQKAASSPGSVDLLFLDPPYHQDWLARILPLCERLVAPGGFVYAESEMPLTGLDAPWLNGWDVVRADRAGMVYYHLLQRKKIAEIQA